MQLPVYARLFYFTKSLDVKRLELMKLFKNSIYKRSIRQESKMYKNASARSSLSNNFYFLYSLRLFSTVIASGSVNLALTLKVIGNK